MRTSFFIGTGAIAYKEWKGKFYPPALPAEEAVPFYARRFSALELNNTFYQTPTEASLKTATEQLPNNFPVIVKAPQVLTHIKRLKDCGAAERQFFRALAALGSHRGPALIQLPPNFKIDLPRLEKFFSFIPRNQPVAMEFRHPSWFTGDVYKFLRREGAALTYNDTDVEMPFVSTADWGYLRLRHKKYADKDFRQLIALIEEQKWRRCFVIFKHEEKALAPKLAERFEALL